MWQIKHCGLYFSREHITTARQNRDREPFKAAWDLLASDLLASDPGDARYVHLLWNSLHAVFNEDDAAATAAIHSLNDEPLLIYIPEDQPYLQTIAQTLVVAQCFEMLRGHPDWNQEAQTRWFEAFAGLITTLLADTDEAGEPVTSRSFIETIWAGLLAVAAGIVLEEEALFESGAAVYRRVVDESIRPQGHLPEAVEQPDGFHQLLWAVNGLTLMAEAAAQVGVDLWGYTNRGVSVVTAGLYPLYFYYYAEKWPWGDAIPVEDAQALFRQHSGYLEMLNRQIGRPTKAIDLVLKEIRPVFDLYDGGLTTLTHGVAPRQRRGLFG